MIWERDRYLLATKQMKEFDASSFLSANWLLTDQSGRNGVLNIARLAKEEIFHLIVPKEMRLKRRLLTELKLFRPQPERPDALSGGAFEIAFQPVTTLSSISFFA